MQEHLWRTLCPENRHICQGEGSIAVNRPRGVRTLVFVIVPTEFYYLSDVKESKAIQHKYDEGNLRSEARNTCTSL
jgi:hypothetical protein